jgi:transcriptional regulator with XRE-family HTH domain
MPMTKQKVKNSAKKIDSQLGSLLSRVITQHSKLSQRGLAKRISVSSGYISKMIKGQKIPSDAVILKISEVLKLRESTVSRLLAAGQRARLDKGVDGSMLPSSMYLASKIHIETDCEIDVRANYGSVKQKQWDEFFRGCELPIASAALFLDANMRNIDWFAKKMGVTRAKAKKMILTLADLGLAQVVSLPDGDLLLNKIAPNPQIFTNISVKQRKVMMKSFLQLVERTLEHQHDDLPLRGMAVALDPSQVPQLHSIIDEAVRKVFALSEMPGPKEKIYCLQVAAIDWDVAKNSLDSPISTKVQPTML